MEQAIYSGLITLALVMLLVFIGFIWRSFLVLRTIISGLREKAMQLRARERAFQVRAHYVDTNRDSGVNNITSMKESPALAEVAAFLMLTRANSKGRALNSVTAVSLENPPNSPLSTLAVSPVRPPQQAEDGVVVQVDLSGPSTPDQDYYNATEFIRESMSSTVK